jgi:hypothetical protein
LFERSGSGPVGLTDTVTVFTRMWFAGVPLSTSTTIVNAALSPLSTHDLEHDTVWPVVQPQPVGYVSDENSVKAGS